MMQPALSLIIPVYNGAAYIEAALVALTAQFTAGVELLVIDDGSTDGTRAIIAAHFAPHIDSGALRIIAQENQGVSSARNLGIASAKGAYIGFVDADDVVLPGYLGTILAALQSNADIVEFAYKPFSDSIAEATGAPAWFTNRMVGEFDARDVLDGVHAIARWYPWTRVFKASLFEEVRFPAGVRMCEDVMTIPLLYEKAARVVVLPDAIYGYRNNQTSATFNVRPDYVPNLEKFYSTIPRDGKLRHDYLRIAIAYAIYSCQRKAGGAARLPEHIASDMRKLRYVASVYRVIEPRKVGILLYPSLFNLFKRIEAFMKPHSL